MSEAAQKPRKASKSGKAARKSEEMQDTWAAKRIKTEVTLHIDPMEGIVAAAMLQKFVPFILDTCRPTSSSGSLASMSITINNVIDELADRSFESLELRKKLAEEFEGVGVI